MRKRRNLLVLLEQQLLVLLVLRLGLLRAYYGSIGLGTESSEFLIATCKDPILFMRIAAYLTNLLHVR